MGQRYNVHFKDYKNTAYDVKVYIEGYVGQVTELLGARSTFTVEGNDENFVYEPIRSSTATLTLLGSDLLLDLFSINNQYAPVKLFKGDKLMWTGYIVPEQFTQPYKPTPDNISIDCISAIGTLENIRYKQQNEDAFIKAIDLLRYILKSANGGYEKIYIPHVYASSEYDYLENRFLFEDLILAEENFISEENYLNEVLEYLCRFLGWSLYDYEGSLYFVDPDWDGEYHAYNEGLTEYDTVYPNEVLLQNIGFAGSNHTIDIEKGYNKATVKAINNAPESMIDEEPYDSLADLFGKRSVDGKITDVDSEWKRYILKTYKPVVWEPKIYDAAGGEIEINADNDPNTGNLKNFGSSIAKISECNGHIEDGVFVPDVSEYSWENAVVCRINSLRSYEDKYWSLSDPLLLIKGGSLLYVYGAICLSFSLGIYNTTYEYQLENREFEEGKYAPVFQLRIGNWYWNGTSWTMDSSSTFRVEVSNTVGYWRSVINTKTVDDPYTGANGYLIKLPDSGLYGDLELRLLGQGFSTPWNDFHISRIGFKDLQVKYYKRDDENFEGEDGDRVYENVVNEEYMTELDEQEFGISTYNNDGASFSKPLLNGFYVTDNIYYAGENEMIRLEESYIRRVINRYRVTKIKLTQVLKNSDSIHPFTILYDNSMVSKKFMLLSGVWDYEQNTLTLSMIENGDKVRYKNR